MARHTSNAADRYRYTFQTETLFFVTDLTAQSLFFSMMVFDSQDFFFFQAGSFSFLAADFFNPCLFFFDNSFLSTFDFVQ